MRLLSPELCENAATAGKTRADRWQCRTRWPHRRRIPEPLRLLDDTAGGHHDDHQRYRANYSFLRADFLSAGLSGASFNYAVSMIRPGCYCQTSLCKTSGTLRRATKVKADENDSAYSNSFNAFSASQQYWRGLSGWNFYFLVRSLACCGRAI